MTITPEEITLVMALLEQAIKAGVAIYDAVQLKDMTALQEKLQLRLQQTATDRQKANADIDARHKELEAELAK